MTSARTALKAVRELGLRTSAHYLHYQAGVKSGWVRRQTPVRPWDYFQVTPEQATDNGGFFWRSETWKPPRHTSWAEEARRDAEEKGRRILEGKFPAFGALWVDLGFQPDWHASVPLAGAGQAKRVTPDRHWSEYHLEDFEADVKLLWEPSRLAWVFHLGRAYRWTERDEFAEGFWRLFTSWRQSHSVNAGPHWISAQEVALRLIALAFARFAFDPWLKQEQLTSLATTVRAHAARIPATVAYSRAQRNNHLLSEATGLLTAGLLFPGLPEARRWAHDGFSWLVDGLDDQIFEDGGYIQHSINYGRLALQLGLWSTMLCRRNRLALPERSQRALVRLADWLGDMVEPASGQAPNFGPNDGSLLLPLTSCDYRDYRPSLQAARAVLGGKAPYGRGPWDELTAWFGTEPSPRRIEQGPARKDHPVVGVYTLGGDESHGFLRAARFRSRPGHFDQLHLDLWRKKRNLALDPGTYLYGGEPPWDNQLVSALVHNTAVVDMQEPMERAGRFLWLDWSQAFLTDSAKSEDGELEMLMATHEGLGSSEVRHQRTLLRAGADLWLVVDDFLGEGTHEVLLPWLVPQTTWRVDEKEGTLELKAFELSLQVRAQELRSSLYSAGERLQGEPLPIERPQWGWYSPTYAYKEPALHWISYWQGTLPFQARTWWCFEGASPDQLELRWEGQPLPQLRTAHLGGETVRR